MKFKTNFKDMREAVVTIGKAVKKNMSPIEISLVKIEAGEDYVELSTNGSIGACVKIQAVVEEAGSFVTSFSGINILSVRKCDGDINASNEVNENTLVLKYRGGKAKTELAAVDKVFNSVANPTDDCANVSLPYASLNIRFSCRFVTCNIAAACLLHIPDWLSLVERLVWDQEAVSSILASGTAG